MKTNIPVIDLKGQRTTIVEIGNDGVLIFEERGLWQGCMYRWSPESARLMLERANALAAFRAADLALEAHRLFDNTTRLPPEQYLQAAGLKTD